MLKKYLEEGTRGSKAQDARHRAQGTGLQGSEHRAFSDQRLAFSYDP